MTERAVSEVVGFVLVVSLIISTVGVVYAVGLGGLQDARDAERVDNAERAFDILADNMADIYKRDAPSRATEIKLADASLSFGTETTIQVSKEGSSTWYGKSVTPIVYDAGTGTQIVYEAGAVIRAQDDGAVMLREPDTVFTTENGVRVAVVPVVETRPAGSGGSVAGTTTVLVRADGAISAFLQPDAWTTWSDQAVDLRVETTATRAEPWEAYLESNIPDNWHPTDDDVCEIPSPGVVLCEFETDQMYVPRTGIDVQFS